MHSKVLIRKVLPLIESALFIFGYYYITYYIFELKDPFFIEKSLNPFILILLLLTLFHGLPVGILSALLLIPIFEKNYHPFPTEFFLWILLIILITGEFHYLWNKKIKLLSEETDYLKGKLRNQMSNFILLKLSHDQLEKHYLLKPISLRSLLTKLKKLLIKSKTEAEDLFVDILLNAFFVESGSIYFLNDGEFEKKLDIGKPVILHLDDPLVREAIENEESVFISSLPEESKTNYLAVIPIKDLNQNAGLIGIFLLKEMPFNYLNADHILALSVAINWFFNQLNEKINFTEVPEKLRNLLSYDFLRELLLLKKLNEEAGIESSIVIFRVPDIHIDFPFFIEKKVRGMDTVDWVSFNNAIYTFVLLPLSPVEAAEGFINRVKNEIFDVFKEDIFFIYRIFPVDSKIFERIEYIVR